MLSLLFYVAMAKASVAETGYAQALARAHSPGEVERLEREYSRLKVAQTACKIELREHSAPVNCYEAVELEMPAKGAEKAARLAHLDELCARAASELNAAAPTPFVSKFCAKKLSEAREIQTYREDEDSAWSRY